MLGSTLMNEFLVFSIVLVYHTIETIGKYGIPVVFIDIYDIYRCTSLIVTIAYF